jgi:hypothetical protein
LKADLTQICDSSWKASIFPFSSEQGNVKEKVQKLFQKPGGGSPFWKK